APVEFFNRELCLTISCDGSRQFCVDSCLFRVGGCSYVLIAIRRCPRLGQLVASRIEFCRSVLTSAGLVGLFDARLGPGQILEGSIRTGSAGAYTRQRHCEQQYPWPSPRVVHRQSSPEGFVTILFRGV